MESVERDAKRRNAQRSTARTRGTCTTYTAVHTLPLIVVHSRAFFLLEGDTPPEELPAQCHFEVLEEKVQDRLFYAESLAQVVSLDTENKHRLSNPDSHSQHVAMLFDGSTIRPKRRLMCSMPVDLEGFRSKFEIIANVWRMVEIRSPGRSVLEGLTENTWKTHRRWPHGLQKVWHGAGSCTRSHESTVLAVVHVVRTQSSRSSNGPDQDARPALGRGTGAGGTIKSTG